MWEVKTIVIEIMGFGWELVAWAESTLWLGYISYIPAEGLREERERLFFFFFFSMEHIKKVLELLMVLGVKWVLSETQTTGSLKWKWLNAAEPKHQAETWQQCEGERAMQLIRQEPTLHRKATVQTFSATVNALVKLCNLSRLKWGLWVWLYQAEYWWLWLQFLFGSALLRTYRHIVK